MLQQRTVPRIRYPELTGFARHFSTNEPAIIVGVPEHHPLQIFQFSPQYLSERLADKAFGVICTTTGFVSYERDVEQMGFQEFVRRTFEAPPSEIRYYFKNSTKLLPGDLDDSNHIRGLSQFFTKSVLKNLWISRGTLTVGLHFDAAENLNIQIRGRKSFLLYPPGTHGYYPCPMFSQTAHISQVFREGPNLNRQRFPQFDPDKAREVVLEEGEILYLPAYWWHQVTSLGDVNINLNTWSLPGLGKQLLHPNQAVRGHYQLLSRYMAYKDITKAPPQTRQAQ
jgi:hypothetical protein